MPRKGFTIIELLVVVAVIGLLVAILLPAIGRARESAQSTQSQSNLRNMGAAAGVYGVDFQDRQWSPISEDFGRISLTDGNGKKTNIEVEGDRAAWAAKRCSAQLRLGVTGNDQEQGWFIPTAPVPLCPAPKVDASIANLRVYFPCSFNKKDGNFGSFRLINASSFSKYVGGRFYDDVFYAPKDFLVLDQINTLKAQPEYQAGGDFFGTKDTVVLSSYCWSPAAMWAPDVLSSKVGFQNPLRQPKSGNVAGLWRTPTASQARFSDLKTRVIEHSWLQNKPNGMTVMTAGKWNIRNEVNPDQLFQVNGTRKTFQLDNKDTGMKQPWWFNEASMSLPNALFFDGHVGPIGVLEAVESNKRIKNKAPATNALKGLFVENSIPDLGAAPYQYGCYDNQAASGCSMHILTVDGILGRDMLGAQ